MLTFTKLPVVTSKRGSAIYSKLLQRHMQLIIFEFLRIKIWKMIWKTRKDGKINSTRYLKISSVLGVIQVNSSQKKNWNLMQQMVVFWVFWNCEFDINFLPHFVIGWWVPLSSFFCLQWEFGNKDVPGSYGIKSE